MRIAIDMKRWVRIIGLSTAIAYMVVIIIMWMYWNYNGYSYVQFQEPNYIIKYSEWVLGIVSIVLLSIELSKIIIIQSEAL